MVNLTVLYSKPRQSRGANSMLVKMLAFRCLDQVKCGTGNRVILNEKAFKVMTFRSITVPNKKKPGYEKKNKDNLLMERLTEL